MASYHGNLLYYFLCLLFFVCVSNGQSSFKPKGIILPVIKDSSTLQYVTQINQRTPFVPVKLSIHLGGQTLWVDCEQGYVSSTYRSAICGSPECKIAKPNICENCTDNPPRPGCNLNACFNTPENPFINTLYSGGEIAVDALSIQSTDGVNPGPVLKVPNFIFTCVPSFLAEGLASGVKGTAGLGRNDIALPSQLARVFGFPRKFAICLSSSTSSRGVVILGDGPYIMMPNIDISKNLIYTPLLINKVGTGYVPYLNEPSSEYFIGVKAINISGKAVPINKKLLAIDKNGFGGTKISTGKPYTVMQTSIYNAVSKAFAEALANVPKVPPVAPFGTCYSSKRIGSTVVGPAVPSIDLILQTQRVLWRIFGANSMVQVNKDVICLGIVDGGASPMTSIVIGGHQIEDNLLQFDIPNSRLGFSSSLLFSQTTCANFNFTSRA
ncbi:OLC1v1020176C1 [Oldenlandia corymbosa var. corymbosa]|uniref:OLC1v1020176C1 n=1 Tax=Oldenlandia corymbosa var. corymbosa TaxID=529605 RepID=A0AAV1EFW6_OLDCO|nr:OLC1v1020176C1 [Oldenlandia corymbosa var. corymbosa]